MHSTYVCREIWLLGYPTAISNYLQPCCWRHQFASYVQYLGDKAKMKISSTRPCKSN